MNYLELVNAVLADTGWSELTFGTFASPGQPGSSIKRFINQAKDEILVELGMQFREEEFSIATYPPEDETDRSSATFSFADSSSEEAAAVVTASSGVFSLTDVNRKIEPETMSSGQDLTGRFYRITSFTSATQVSVVPPIDGGSGVASEYTIFQDEYDLNARVRGLIWAWDHANQEQLEIVSQAADLAVEEPANIERGQPEQIALIRSDTSDRISRVILHPAPDAYYPIVLKAQTVLADLSGGTDNWELEPEIKRFIIDRAILKVLNSPLQTDPELAVSRSRSDAQAVARWKQANLSQTPRRRRIRRPPDDDGDLPNRQIRPIVVS